ncbi:related to DUG2-putative di-and tri-peptidase [Sporisorium reilianum f. sp. reilianum]|uniref:Related to DUG2-putative di-and tri-peptidase n=1 Tax=Sporisorium reilianum f. sp. reilianum TaxID=72559 RepID=A0A2N8UC96_9BASI|nr:related to DUG2-putative di-and tri-peptidase [Sporisorium reilianum f. sp. reilianum]
MCSPNVHYEHFLNRPSSSSRQPTDNIASLAQAISSLSSTSTTNASAAASTSALLGHTINHHSSVLSLVVDERRNLLYSGSQEGCISVWDLGTYHSTARLSGHTASVLALELAPEKSWLFSSSGDNTVRVWDTLTNTPLFVILPAEDNVGDIFALKWCAVLETLYIGCQSTSIQWICLAGFDKRKRYSRGNVAPGGGLEGRLADGAPGATTDDPFRADSPIISTPDLLSRPHKFFDSVPVALSRSGMGSAGISTPTRPNARPSAVSALSSTDAAMHRKSPLIPESEQAFHSNGALATVGATEKVLHAASQRLDSAAVPSPGLDSSAASIDPGSDSIRTLLIPPTSSVPSAHFGYVYCLALLTLEGDTEHPTVLASGSGDESIKLWHATRSGLSLLATIESPNADGNAVLALASWKTTLFSGLQGGEVEVWDLETCTLVRTIRAHTDDVICLETCPESGLLFTAGADGKVHTWDRSFRCISRVQAHDGIVLSLTKVRSEAPDAVDDVPGEFGQNAQLQTPKVLQLITGSSDNLIKIWDTLPVRTPAVPSSATAALRREAERLSLDSATPSFGTTPMAIAKAANANTSANVVGVEAASILAATTNGGSSSKNGDIASAQWPLLRSLLRKFISYPSVSSSEEHREDCRQAAHFLKTCFQELGAEARVLPNPVGTNPLVLATFKANAYRSRRRRTAAANYERSRSTSTSTSASASTAASTNSSESFLSVETDALDEEDEDESEGLSGSIMFDRLQDASEQSAAGDDDEARASRPGRKRRCLFYGHYDCIAAEGSWASDPFTLDGRDGYLYGRGVSDNKGPILAAACAVHHLLSTRRLYSDVVFLIEGEEENGSVGFVEAVRRYKREIGEIDVVLLSNSYWLDEETPCLTIGLRGVVRATVSVASGDRDVHSGVEGGAIREPMVDMVKLLARLTGSGEQVALPGFYDSVRPITETEIQAYKDIVRIKQSLNSTAGEAGGRHSETVESLMAKWRNPSLSVHNIRVSGPGNSTVIPSSVSAQVSLRLVPDQDLPTIEASLLQHVHTTFDSLYPPLARPSSRNKVSVSVDHRADWWLGSSSSSYLQLLRHAVKHEWDAEPILIREGGSIPAIAILEKELGACAVHLPMGQSSDNAHLPNERLRQRNLVKGQNVVRRFIQGLAAI